MEARNITRGTHAVKFQLPTYLVTGATFPVPLHAPTAHTRRPRRHEGREGGREGCPAAAGHTALRAVRTRKDPRTQAARDFKLLAYADLCASVTPALVGRRVTRGVFTVPPGFGVFLRIFLRDLRHFAVFALAVGACSVTANAAR
jgi:hypothetical protein